MKHILLFSIISLALVGCGGDEGNSDRVMEKGESYSVSKGDVVVKKSNEALVKIIHKDGSKTSSISLLEGNVTITHPTQK